MSTQTARIVVGVVVALCGLGVSTHAQLYEIAVLPADVSVSGCSSQSLNQSGQVVGYAFGHSVYQAILMNSDGAQTNIGSLFGSHTFPYGLNDAGQVIGTSYDQSGSNHAFVWTPNSHMWDVAGPNSYPCGLNNSGDVVGAWGNTGHGFVYGEGRTHDLNSVTVFGADRWDYLGTGMSISDAGHILGGGLLNGSWRYYVLTPQNLLRDGGFEDDDPPALSAAGSSSSGWVSDRNRQVPAKSEWNQPHSGKKNAACWSTDYLDCGMYQDFVTYGTGRYTLTFYANADRAGGLVGVDIDGATIASTRVEPRGFRHYGSAYTITFRRFDEGLKTIHVWMYSPATPGYVVIDDVRLSLMEGGFIHG
jgi:probable HAF family extracellular repeat protein